MKLKPIKKFRTGMIAFARKQNLMTRIVKVEAGQIEFDVMNGNWRGTIPTDGAAYHMHGEIEITHSDFAQVLSVTEDEFSRYYMIGEKGAAALLERDDNLPVSPDVLAQSDEADSVQEIQILVTVQGQDEDPAAFTDWVRGLSLSDLEHHMEDGELIGQSRIIFSETLPPDQVGPRLKDLANDGTFFNLDEEASFDPNAKKHNSSSRILNAQMAQGWDTETLEMLSRRFIDAMGLSDTYARFIEDQAREENELSSDPDEGPGF
jgi:hypothetical protein